MWEWRCLFTKQAFIPFLWKLLLPASIQLSMGATEIGQGADTVFTQMAAETTGISVDRVYINSTQDTDVTPFDTGAYASRQTYVSGMACKKCALEFRCLYAEP